MMVARETWRFSLVRPPVGWMAAAVLAIGLIAARACGADEISAKAVPTVAAVDESAATAPTKPQTADGCVLCNGIRLQDEIQVVNTRNVCGSCEPEKLRNGIQVETYAIRDEVGYRCWRKSDLESFLSFDPSVPTIIFVHGNQITAGDAKNEGLATYRTLILQGCDAPRIRFVIYSWPSAKVSGLLRDVRIKAARTGPESYHLAWLLDQMPAETPVSLVGFSFGARIITGSLHIVAGGTLGGSMVLAEHVHSNRAPVNVVVMAAATDAHWLAEGQHHGMALTQVNRMLLINNCDDPAMRYYDLLTPGHGGPRALGLCGPTRISPQYKEKIFNRDVSCYVGSQHELTRYVCAPGDAALIWDFAGPAAATAAKVAAK